MRHLDADWGLRGVRIKGGKALDGPIDGDAVPAAVRRACARPRDRWHHSRDAAFWSRYATIRPTQLKRAVAFYEDKASRPLSG